MRWLATGRSGKSESVISMHTAAERPDLWERGIDSASVWPEYNLHGDVLNQWWGLLDVELADFQFVLYDEAEDVVVAEGHTGPLVVGRSRRDAAATASTPRSSASSRTAAPGHRSTRSVRAGRRDPERRAGAAAWPSRSSRRCAPSPSGTGCSHLVAPVRPSWKERYPMTPIERYVTWRRDDGQLLDPWMRVHERLGARVATPLPGVDADHRHRRRVGGMDRAGASRVRRIRLPPRARPAPIDRDADRGVYWEPNVWMIHPDINPSTESA